MANRVFLSYARNDEDRVRPLYEALRARDVDVWFDRVHLKPGRWYPQILRAITQSRFFVACISRAALQRLEASPGFQDTELMTAYQIALDQAEDCFTIVPVRLDDCDRGDHRLSAFQQYDLFFDFDAVVSSLAVSFGGKCSPSADAKPKPAPDSDAEVALAIYGKAALRYAVGDFTKALTLIHSVEELIGPSVATLNDRAATLHAIGRYPEALDAVDKAIAMNADISVVWENRGKILLSSARPEDAHVSFNRASLLDPASKEALFGMSRALFTLDRREEALNMLARLVDIDPTNATAHAARGVIYERMRHDDDALRASRRAVELDPTIAVAHETIGLVLVRSHRCQDALPHLEKAIALGSRAASVHSAKGVALMDCALASAPAERSERLKEAERSFNEALRINPSCGQAVRCKELLSPLLRPK